MGARPAVVVLLAAATMLHACEDPNDCDSIAIGTELDVDVTAFADATEVCLNEGCTPVRSGLARYRDTDAEPSPLRPRKMTQASLRVLDSDGNPLRQVDEVDVPGYYADGRSCGSYAPYGTVVVTEDDVESTDDYFK